MDAMRMTIMFGKFHNFPYRIKKRLELITYLGNGKRCPVCNRNSKKFSPFGNPHRDNAKCVWCGSLERHRLIWLFFQRKTDLLNGKPKKMLHVAPEDAFIKPLSRSIGDGYITADLYNKAMVKVDITNMNFPSESFDVIYCCHVLEHIVDDIRAINELARVLKKDGWALIVVPISGETTYEDKSIIDPADRLVAFGQSDHVRICGTDYMERLENNGFIIEKYNTDDVAANQERENFGLQDVTLYYCRKYVPDYVRKCDGILRGSV